MQHVCQVFFFSFFLIFTLFFCSLQTTNMSRGAWWDQIEVTICSWAVRLTRVNTETCAMTDCDLIGAGLNLLKTELNYRLIGNRIPCLAFQFDKKKKKETTQRIATQTNKQNKSHQRQLRPFVVFYWKDTVQVLCEWHHSLVVCSPYLHSYYAVVLEIL